MESFSREIIVYKLPSYQNQSNKAHLGYVRAVAEKNGDSYTPLYNGNFCATGKVFVTAEYEEINNDYDDFELFKVIIIESNQYRPEDAGSDRNCKYITLGTKTSSLMPRELIEVISNPLPNPNIMIVDIITPPSTQYIYLNDNGICYGPFKWKLEDESRISLRKIDAPMPGTPLEKGCIYTGVFEELRSHVVYCPLEEGERTYFVNLAELHNDPHLVEEDYSSDEEVISNFIKVTKDMGFGSKKVDIGTLERNVKDFPKSEHTSITRKLNSLKNIYDTNQLLREDVTESISNFLRSEIGNDLIDKHINKNKDNYLSIIENNYKVQLEEKFREDSAELANLKEKIERNKQELISLGRDIEVKNKIKIKDHLFGEVTENKDLTSEIIQKKAQIEDLESKLAPLLERYNTYKSLHEVNERFSELTKDYEYEFKRKLLLSDEIKNLEDAYKEGEDKLRTKLFKMKPFVEAINGNVGAAPSINEKKVSQEVSLNNVANTTAQDILGYIQSSLQERNRNLSMLDVINIVVTIQQSFICFLAGLPGGGKTTLARLIAEIYAIRDQRFLDVPVARGWTGQKDLIGFLNPISNSFQASSTGMYEFLNALHEESSEDVEVPASMILLDEANLSPMEHYWSSFMGLTDSDNTKKEVTLGYEKIQIPEHLRFLATINYDSTTESLSPRLIDRSPVIVLEPNSIATIINKETSEKPSIEMPISHKVMEHYFGNVEQLPEFIENERRVYDKIKAVLELRDSELGKPVTISGRKEIAIKQYCNKARPLMREYSTDEELLALDYATLQLILPLLRGHGRSFSKRLEKLREVLFENELEHSVNYLKVIISNGDAELHTYDFFCW